MPVIRLVSTFFNFILFMLHDFFLFILLSNSNEQMLTKNLFSAENRNAVVVSRTVGKLIIRFIVIERIFMFCDFLYSFCLLIPLKPLKG